MTDYAITGKKRSGKGLFCVGLIRDALLSGKRVVTNMDIWPDQMLPPLSRATIVRLPDCPTVEDMEFLGRGYEGEYDDDRNGLIVLDESSKFFNARQWGDKARQPLLDWLIHSGKLGWDVYYQMQGLEQIDKQVRDVQTGYFTITGRIDDVLNVSGHRMGTMEIESALVSHPMVAEAAVVGRPDELTGEAICAFVVLKGARPVGEAAGKMIKELQDHVAKEIGPIAKPKDIRFGENLPKTRSGKIMRRLLRSLAKGETVAQDVSTLENPAILEQLRGHA